MTARRLAVTIAILCGASLSILAQRSSQPYQKWEYKVINGCNEEDQKIDIHKLGEEGWELVGFDATNCSVHHFKRPLREGAKPSASTPVPATPAAPQCVLPLEKAPVIRGLRLGMSFDDLLALFPGKPDRWADKDTIKNVDKPPHYGAAKLMFQPRQSSENGGIFEGVSWYQIIVFDGKVSEIGVSYSPTASQSVFWTDESWIAKLSETFGLPAMASWQGKGQKQLACNGFELKTWVSSSDERNTAVPFKLSHQGLTITDLAFKKIIEQRIKDDHEKKRREFKF